MSTEHKLDKEAYERIERQFTSSNDVSVERASVRSSDWERAKRYLKNHELTRKV